MKNGNTMINKTHYATVALIALAACLAHCYLISAADVPVVDATSPVVVPATEARTYTGLYPVLLVYRFVNDRPLVQTLEMAPAEVQPDGSLDVLADPARRVRLSNFDIRTESDRSPVVRAMVTELVRVLGLLAKERAVSASITTALAADPEADVTAQQATLATLRQALQVTE